MGKLKLYVFLTSALDGGDWSDSRLGHFNPGREPPIPMW